MGAVVICAPATFPVRHIAYCPNCQRRRRFSGRCAVWYSPQWICCACGDSWCDGERMERPFRRGWRADAIKRAREDWDAAAGLTRADWRAWLSAQLDGSP